MSRFHDSNTVKVNEAKTHRAELLAKVEAGQEITIARHGTPVARLVPVTQKSTVSQRAAAVKRIRKLGQGRSLGGLKIKDLIAEGRK